MELEHSAKGTTWSKHKYIRIENGRYIYSETKAKGSKDSYQIGKGESGDRAASVAEIHNALKNFKLAGKGKGKSSSSKKSGSSKEKSGKGGSAKEKAEKTSTKSARSSEENDEEKIQTAATEGEKIVRTIDEEYSKALEDYKKKLDDRSQLPKVRAKAKRPKRYS